MPIGVVGYLSILQGATYLYEFLFGKIQPGTQESDASTSSEDHTSKELVNQTKHQSRRHGEEGCKAVAAGLSSSDSELGDEHSQFVATGLVIVTTGASSFSNPVEEAGRASTAGVASKHQVTSEGKDQSHRKSPEKEQDQTSAADANKTTGNETEPNKAHSDIAEDSVPATPKREQLKKLTSHEDQTPVGKADTSKVESKREELIKPGSCDFSQESVPTTSSREQPKAASTQKEQGPTSECIVGNKETTGGEPKKPICDKEIKPFSTASSTEQPKTTPAQKDEGATSEDVEGKIGCKEWEQEPSKEDQGATGLVVGGEREDKEKEPATPSLYDKAENSFQVTTINEQTEKISGEIENTHISSGLPADLKKTDCSAISNKTQVKKQSTQEEEGTAHEDSQSACFNNVTKTVSRAPCQEQSKKQLPLQDQSKTCAVVGNEKEAKGSSSDNAKENNPTTPGERQTPRDLAPKPLGPINEADADKKRKVTEPEPMGQGSVIDEKDVSTSLSKKESNDEPDQKNQSQMCKFEDGTEEYFMVESTDDVKVEQSDESPECEKKTPSGKGYSLMKHPRTKENGMMGPPSDEAKESPKISANGKRYSLMRHPRNMENGMMGLSDNNQDVPKKSANGKRYSLMRHPRNMENAMMGKSDENKDDPKKPASGKRYSLMRHPRNMENAMMRPSDENQEDPKKPASGKRYSLMRHPRNMENGMMGPVDENQEGPKKPAIVKSCSLMRHPRNMENAIMGPTDENQEGPKKSASGKRYSLMRHSRNMESGMKGPINENQENHEGPKESAIVKPCSLIRHPRKMENAIMGPSDENQEDPKKPASGKRYSLMRHPRNMENGMMGVSDSNHDGTKKPASGKRYSLVRHPRNVENGMMGPIDENQEGPKEPAIVKPCSLMRHPRNMENAMMRPSDENQEDPKKPASGKRYSLLRHPRNMGNGTVEPSENNQEGQKKSANGKRYSLMRQPRDMESGMMGSIDENQEGAKKPPNGKRYSLMRHPRNMEKALMGPNDENEEGLKKSPNAKRYSPMRHPQNMENEMMGSSDNNREDPKKPANGKRYSLMRHPRNMVNEMMGPSDEYQDSPKKPANGKRYSLMRHPRNMGKLQPNAIAKDEEAASSIPSQERSLANKTEVFTPEVIISANKSKSNIVTIPAHSESKAPESLDEMSQKEVKLVESVTEISWNALVRNTRCIGRHKKGLRVRQKFSTVLSTVVEETLIELANVATLDEEIVKGDTIPTDQSRMQKSVTVKQQEEEPATELPQMYTSSAACNSYSATPVGQQQRNISPAVNWKSTPVLYMYPEQLAAYSLMTASPVQQGPTDNMSTDQSRVQKSVPVTGHQQEVNTTELPQVTTFRVAYATYSTALVMQQQGYTPLAVNLGSTPVLYMYPEQLTDYLSKAASPVQQGPTDNMSTDQSRMQESVSVRHQREERHGNTIPDGSHQVKPFVNGPPALQSGNTSSTATLKHQQSKTTLAFKKAVVNKDQVTSPKVVPVTSAPEPKTSPTACNIPKAATPLKHQQLKTILDVKEVVQKKDQITFSKVVPFAIATQEEAQSVSTNQSKAVLTVNEQPNHTCHSQSEMCTSSQAVRPKEKGPLTKVLSSNFVETSAVGRTGSTVKAKISKSTKRRRAKARQRERQRAAAGAEKRAAKAEKKETAEGAGGATVKEIGGANSRNQVEVASSSSNEIVLNFDDDSHYAIDWEAEAARPFYNSTAIFPPRVATPDWAEWDFSQNERLRQLGRENPLK